MKATPITVTPNTVGSATRQVQRIFAGDLRQARHDQNVGGEHRPAAHPADVRTESAGAPGERGAAVGIGAVEIKIGAAMNSIGTKARIKIAGTPNFAARKAVPQTC